jgi:hypothetical protein
MLDKNTEEMLKGMTDSEIATLIGLAYREKQNRDEAKKTKYMNAINKAIQDYLDNVGDLTFHVEYEDEDGQDAETDITVDNTNPPAGGNGVIYIKE